MRGTSFADSSSSCVAAAKYGPDPAAAVNNGILNKAWATVETMAPVKTFVGTPPAEYQQSNTDLFAAQFNGINSMVCKFKLLHGFLPIFLIQN